MLPSSLLKLLGGIQNSRLLRSLEDKQKEEDKQLIKSTEIWIIVRVWPTITPLPITVASLQKHLLLGPYKEA